MVKLLIIDDELPVCDLLKNFFTERNYKVFVALNGEDGIAVMDKEKPQIVFLDIRMPDVSGIEILRRMKKKNHQVKVIMITAVKDEAMITLAKEYGAYDYIVKPFNLEHLEKDVLPRVMKQLT